MKLHAALCMAWCFLGTMQLARCGVLQNLGLEEAVREEVGAILEEAFRGGETFGFGMFNAAEDAEAGRPTEYLALINYFLKKAVPDKATRLTILRAMLPIQPGDLTAESVAAMMADAGINGSQDDTLPEVNQLIAILEKHIPRQEIRNKLYRSLATIRLGDIKAIETGPITYMLEELSK